MKTFEFETATRKNIVNAFNLKYGTEIDDVLALVTIQKYWGIKCKIHLFRTYINSEIVYVLYEDDNTILEFDDEKSAIKFIVQ